MNLKTANQGDDRAVSPVIGVILMVAITVILAAVIGTFVLGLGDQLGDSQPSAQLEMSVDDSTSNIVIEHTGGNEIDLSEFTIQARGGGDEHANATLSATVADKNTLGVGESATVRVTTGGGNSVDNVRLIHNPSNSIYADRTLTIEDFTSFDTS
ncbi:type IV pilin [Halorubrum halophilum]|uniref:type IV pilin n=1 Tax=Halorubrum halophilum TaxID=413816 RepID=UPI00067921EC|nr:type IV pilin N-terminal domain-containing protein [Halorubrum halophilum]